MDMMSKVFLVQFAMHLGLHFAGMILKTVEFSISAVL